MGKTTIEPPTPKPPATLWQELEPKLERLINGVQAHFRESGATLHSAQDCAIIRFAVARAIAVVDGERRHTQQKLDQRNRQIYKLRKRLKEMEP
jgi:hypothetical protein